MGKKTNKLADQKKTTKLISLEDEVHGILLSLQRDEEDSKKNKVVEENVSRPWPTGSDCVVQIEELTTASKKARITQSAVSIQVRNWLALPKSVTLNIFLKLGVIEILCSAQYVCSSWRKFSKEPHLFRSIDMRDPWNYFDLHDFKKSTKMIIEAIDRSHGELLELSLVHYGTDEVLQHIGNKSRSLRCLRLAICKMISENEVIRLVQKLPCLEEFELCCCSFSNTVIKVAGCYCPQLKSFRLNHGHYRGKFPRPGPPIDLLINTEGYMIADNMRHLRRLHLDICMDNNGLEAILDGCCQLEYLDVRECRNVDLNGELGKRCKGIVDKCHDDSYQFVRYVQGCEVGLLTGVESGSPMRDYWLYIVGKKKDLPLLARLRSYRYC